MSSNVRNIFNETKAFIGESNWTTVEILLNLYDAFNVKKVKHDLPAGVRCPACHTLAISSMLMLFFSSFFTLMDCIES